MMGMRMLQSAAGMGDRSGVIGVWLDASGSPHAGSATMPVPLMGQLVRSRCSSLSINHVTPWGSMEH